MKWFVVEDTPYHFDEWVIRPSEKFYEKFSGIRGSYAVYPARLCGFTYGDWCRYCRNNYGAKLYGGSKYIIITFPNKTSADTLAKILNDRMNKIVKEIVK